MRLTSFVVWKSWVSNPLRTSLTLLGIALGVAVVTAIHVLDHNTIQSRLRQRVADYGRVDLELLPKAPERSASDVRAQLLGKTDMVATVGLLHGGETGAPAVASDGKRGIPVALYGLSPMPSREFAHYHVASGSDLSDLDGDGHVLIGRGLAEELGLSLGAEFELRPPTSAPVQRCIDGVLITDATTVAKGETLKVKVKGILSEHALGRQARGAVILGSYSLARRVAPFAQTYYQINRVPGANPDVLKRDLEADFQVLDQRSAMLGEGSDERAFRNGIKILGLLALVMGMLVVFQTQSQILLERLKQIGLMRCLGSSRRSMAWIFLVEGLLLAGIGAGIGVVLGILLAYGMGRMEWTTLGVGKQITDFDIPPRPVIFAAALGVFFTLAGSAFPLWKARGLSPLQVLQVRGLGDSGYLLRGVNVFLFLLLVVVLPISYLAMTPLMAEEGRETRLVLLEVAGIVLLFGGVLLIAPKIVQIGGRLILLPIRGRAPLPVFLVEKALGRGPGRFAAAVCGLAVVLVALVSLKHITWSLRAEVRQFAAATMDDHLFFGEGAPVAVDKLDALAGLPGVVSMERIVGTAQVGFLLRGVPADDLARPGGLFEDRVEDAAAYQSERCLIVSRRWSELQQKKVGQTKTLLTGTTSQRYRIIGISDRAGFFPDERAWAIAAPRWLERDFCTRSGVVTRVSLEVQAGADPAAIRDAVRAVFPHSWFKTGNSIRRYLLRDVTRDFLMFDALLLMILGLVGLGLVNTMTIAAIGRAREIGVLRALGMEDRALRQSFLVEGVLVGGLAAVVAIAMGIPLGYVVVEGLNKVTGLDAPFVIPWPYVGLVPVLALATGVLASIVPGLRAIRMNPAEAVRYE